MGFTCRILVLKHVSPLDKIQLSPSCHVPNFPTASLPMSLLYSLQPHVPLGKGEQDPLISSPWSRAGRAASLLQVLGSTRATVPPGFAP